MLMELTVAGVAACKHNGHQVDVHCVCLEWARRRCLTKYFVLTVSYKMFYTMSFFLLFSNIANVRLADLLFGVLGKYTGVSHYNRKRVVTYTITVVFSRYDAG